ncbi:MAG: hypothetical protein FWC50_06040 [Planctomycetaceae bacterium]|nr:hypothetical protein [Planctomycetaceae bacterium]
MSQQYPSGLEVLLRKAAVDADFCLLLKKDWKAAAASIMLELGNIEKAIFGSIPMEQLDTIIRQMEVPSSQQQFFLGSDVSVMLAVIAEEEKLASYRSIQCGGGVRPDMPKE